MKRGLRIFLGRNRYQIYGLHGQGVGPARQEEVGLCKEDLAPFTKCITLSHKCFHCVNNATDHNNDCKS